MSQSHHPLILDRIWQYPWIVFSPLNNVMKYFRCTENLKVRYRNLCIYQPTLSWLKCMSYLFWVLLLNEPIFGDMYTGTYLQYTILPSHSLEMITILSLVFMISRNVFVMYPQTCVSVSIYWINPWFKLHTNKMIQCIHTLFWVSLFQNLLHT